MNHPAPNMFVPRDLGPIRYTKLQLHNQLLNTRFQPLKLRFHADLRTRVASTKSTLCGLISICSLSSLSRFSIIHLASMAVASRSIQACSSCLMVLDIIAEWLSAASSKSCSEAGEASNKKSNGGSGISPLFGVRMSVCKVMTWPNTLVAQY